MEILKLKEFLKINYDTGSGTGYGSGTGSGGGSGYGDGYGDGYGGGSGYGDGYGDGYGTVHGSGIGYDSIYSSGSGYGGGYALKIKSINKNTVYFIDDIPTLIFHIKNDIAKGVVVKEDLTLEKCYIAKGQNKFAHR